MALCRLLRPCSRDQWDLLRKLWRTAIARPFVGPSLNRDREKWDYEMYFTAVDFFYRDHDDPVQRFKSGKRYEQQP